MTDNGASRTPGRSTPIMQPRNILIFSAVAVALAAGIAGVVRATRFEERARQAEQAAVQSQHRVESLLDSVQQGREEAARWRRQAAARETVLVTRIEALPPADSFPPPCRAGILQRDSIIGECQAVIGDLRLAMASDSLVIGRLFAVRGEDSTTISLLRQTLASRPGAVPTLFQRLIPSLGVGGFAGVCLTGSPCAGVGLTLSWRF